MCSDLNLANEMVVQTALVMEFGSVLDLDLNLGLRLAEGLGSMSEQDLGRKSEARNRARANRHVRMILKKVALDFCCWRPDEQTNLKCLSWSFFLIHANCASQSLPDQRCFIVKYRFETSLKYYLFV